MAASAVFIIQQLTLAGELREIDGWEKVGRGFHVHGPGGTRSYSLAEADAFVRGLLASRAGAHLRAAQPEHDAGCWVKATRGELPRWPEQGRRP